jgi:hypothetical protein
LYFPSNIVMIKVGGARGMHEGNEV